MKRLNPFSGMQVTLFDATFSAVETANAVKQRINSDLYNSGVVNGLTVFESSTRTGTVAFTQGVAYDPNGERIGALTLSDQVTYSGSLLNDTAVYQVALRYFDGSDGTSGLDVNGVSNFRHITEQFSTIVAKQGVDTFGANDVVLAQVFSSSPGASLIFNSAVRSIFSAKFNAGNTGFQGANVALGGSLIVAGCATFLLGMVVYSLDGTKQARVRLDNNGYLAIEPLNYTLS